MSMEMTLEEKVRIVIAKINEARTVQKTNPVYIPIAYFKAENLGFPTPRDVFRVLRENGTIKNLSSWWGCDEIKDGKQVFIKTNADEPQTDDDFKVYEIEVDEHKLHQLEIEEHISKNSVAIDSQSPNVFFDKKSCRISYGDKFHKFQKAKGRGEMFALLWEARRIEKNGSIVREGAFKSILELAVAGKFVKNSEEFEDKPATTDRSVRDAIQDFRDAIKKIKAPMEILAQNGFMLGIQS